MRTSSGVLLVNLGSPQSLAPSDVRRYLREFLMDPKVIDLPWLVRFCLVYGIVLPLRTSKTIKAYRRIWTENGSPLVHISHRLVHRLRQRISVPLELAMRYGNPSIADGLHALARQGVGHVLVVPLFPQYASATWGSVEDQVECTCRQLGLRYEFIGPYYRRKEYIDALSEVAKPWLDRCGGYCWVFSFHGLPERQILKTDPTGSHCFRRPDCCEVPSPAHERCYRYQCFSTVRAFLEGKEIRQHVVSFQSRFGKGRWLRPYTEEVLKRLPKEGVREVVVVCPSFTTDCLETLEEVAMRGRETFLQAGGRVFEFVPSLNDHPRWVEALAQWVTESLNR